MVGRSLRDIRSELTALSTDDGTYRIVCARTEATPFPVGGERYPDRETAARAVELALEYRAALRRYDPRLPAYDLIVAEGPESPVRRQRTRTSLVDYCHSVAGGLFEALSDRHPAVERAVMDRYLDAAETIEGRDVLCVRMIESMAHEMGTRLTPAEQAALVERAVTERPGTDRSRPLQTALDRLAAVGLIEGYRVRPRSDGPGRRSKTVELEGYRLRAGDGHLPTLPIVVEFVAHSGVLPHVYSAETGEGGEWTVSLSAVGDAPPAGLAAVPTGEA